MQRRLREKRLKGSVEQSAAAELLQSWGRRRQASSKAAAASTRRRAFSLPMSSRTKDSDHVAVVRLVDWDTAQDTARTHLRRPVPWS